MKVLKKQLSLLMSFLLVITLWPATAVADDGPLNAPAQVQQEGEDAIVPDKPPIPFGHEEEAVPDGQATVPDGQATVPDGQATVLDAALTSDAPEPEAVSPEPGREDAGKTTRDAADLEGKAQSPGGSSQSVPASGEAGSKAKGSSADLALLGVQAAEGVSPMDASGETTLLDAFPDPAFRSYVKQTVLNDAGLPDSTVITESHLSAFRAHTDINVNSSGITSLAGIEYFTRLNTLYCGKNQIESLDLSSNTLLVTLTCGENKLTSLTVGGGANLTSLSCGSNQLASLDVSKNTNLTSLSCANNNLASLDVSKNKKLKTLSCYGNDLTALDVSANSALTSLSCENNDLAQLTMGSHPALKQLTCYNNFDIPVLDVTGCPILEKLDCSSNKIAGLDLSANSALQELNCFGNLLSALDVSGNAALRVVSCGRNALLSIQGLNALSLSTFSASNQAVSIPVITAASGAYRYESRWPYPLEEGFGISITQGTATYDADTQLFKAESLDTVDFTSNSGTKSISGTIMFSGTSYDVEFADWDGTQLKNERVDHGADATPPADPEREGYAFLGWDKPYTNITEATVITAQYFEKANPVGLTLREAFPDDAFRTYVKETVLGNGALPDETTIDDGYAELIRKVTSISVPDRGIASLKGLEFFTAVKTLECPGNDLVQLDVSENPTLQELDCSSNALTALKADDNPLLTALDCSGNHLLSIAGLAALGLSSFVAENQTIDVPAIETLAPGYLFESRYTYSLEDGFTLTFDQGLAEYNESTQMFLTNTLEEHGFMSTCGTRALKGTISFTSTAYDVRFVDWDGAVLKSERVAHGADATPPVDPSREGYEFAGWDKPLTGIVEETKFTALYRGGTDPTGLTLIAAFPDDAFRAYVKETVLGDGSLSDYDRIDAGKRNLINGSITVRVRERGIGSLTGIEYFGSLRSLYCNLNQIAELDVSNNTKLELLSCEDNQLSALDVNSNPAMKTLYCQNNRLEELDVRSNLALEVLRCDYNELTALDVSGKAKLTDLRCDHNQLETLDVRGAIVLKALDCASNHIEVLDLSSVAELEELDCTGNKLDALEVSDNAKLVTLGCSDNMLAELDVSGNLELTTLHCNLNKLVAIDVSKNEKLEVFGCTANKIEEIDVSNNAALKVFYCDFNELTEIDVSGNPALELFHCRVNRISDIDLSNNLLLENFRCESNQLTTLDVSNNTKLTALECLGNDLTSLDVSNNRALTSLTCYWNHLLTINGLEGLDLDWFDGHGQTVTIPVGVFSSEGFSYRSTQAYPLEAGFDLAITQGTAHYDTDTQRFLTDAFDTVDFASTDGGITVSGTVTFQEAVCTVEFQDWDGTVLKSEVVTHGAAATPPADPTRDGHRFLWWDKPYAPITDDTVVTAVYADKTNPVLLTLLEAFPDSAFRAYVKESVLGDGTLLDTAVIDQGKAALIKAHLYIGVDNLGIRNLKGIEYFGSLMTLTCRSNELVVLDVSSNGALLLLVCDSNRLTSLDVSGNAALGMLSCKDNLLTSLDVGENTALTALSCDNNKLTGLDVSVNAKLGTLTCTNNGLTALTVGANAALRLLDCSSNPQLTSLDVSGCPALENLYCNGTGIAALDLGGNVALVYLECNEANLTELDVSGNAELRVLKCAGNALTDIDVSANTSLGGLDCGSNELEALDLSGNGNLQFLICNSNRLTSLDVDGNKWLAFLDCADNQLEVLDLSTNPSIQNLYCNNNELTSITGFSSQGLIEYRADGQKVALPVGMSSQEGFMYESIDAHPIDVGFDVTFDQDAAEYDTVTQRFLTNGLDDAYFTSASDGIALQGTISFEAVTYSVEFKDWDGAALKTETVIHGGDATPPTAPMRDKYRFMGWDGPYATITKDTVLNARYQSWDDPAGLTLVDAFPDDAFRAYVKEDVLEDAALPDDALLEGAYADAIKARKDVLVADLGIRSLAGIEFFAAAERVDCAGNLLNHLDLRANAALKHLACDGNMLLTVAGLSGLDLDSFSADDQALDVSMAPRISRTFSYQSIETYQLEAGFEAEVSEAEAAFDAFAGRFLTNILDEVGFTSTDGRYAIRGTVAFDAEEHIVLFVDWDGTLLKAETVPQGGDATPPDVPEREGWIFTGWDSSYNNVTACITVTAVYASDPGDDPVKPDDDEEPIDPNDPDNPDNPVDPNDPDNPVNPVDPNNPNNPNNPNSPNNPNNPSGPADGNGGSGADGQGRTTPGNNAPSKGLATTGDMLAALMALVTPLALLGTIVVVREIRRRRERPLP